jgi:hypothetical protein
MAIIFTYPSINSGNLQPEDRFILSQMNEPTNPTRSVTLGTLATYISNNITPPPAVIPWPYQYDAGLATFIQGSNPGTTGISNTGYGVGVLSGLTSGRRNIGIGDNAGNTLTVGENNIVIGNGTVITDPNANNRIAIGEGTVTHGDNTFVMGNISTASIEASNGNTTDLGTTVYPWKDYYGEGNINLGNINSRIGVGIAYAANTKGAVEVDAFIDYNGSPFNYFIPNGVPPTGYPIGVFDYYSGPDLFAISYWGSGRFMGSGIHIFSDERSKNIHGLSKSKEDLDIINNIEITEFNYIDPVKGSGKQKKVIAQQVEKVYPNAVSTGLDVIPNIFKESEVHSGLIKIENTCKVGDKIQLVYEDNTKEIVEVTACHSSQIITTSKKKGKVFVYGTEINDYKSVDYDAISMLNVSATQELHKIIVKLEKKIEDLTKKVNSLKNK